MATVDKESKVTSKVFTDEKIIVEDGLAAIEQRTIRSEPDKTLSFKDELRKTYAKEILDSFLKINKGFLWCLGGIFLLETILIVTNIIDPKDRVIDTRAVIALVTGITLQFGAMAFGISGWLFKKQPEANKVKK